MQHTCRTEWGISKKANGEFFGKINSFEILIFILYSYVNMDYIFFSSIAGTQLRKIVISYDIACQWGRHLRHRLETSIPRHLHPSPDSDTDFELFVPKFHLPAHKPDCHAPYSFNYAPGVGRTDGEGIERNWSVLNKVAPSLSMMGPGGRWDTMDDVCNYWNWSKTVNLGRYPWKCLILFTVTQTLL
jgi:Kyakuja-Dileera-Zisupton transposase